MLYSGGMAVSKGFYWSPMDGGRVDMTDNGILPGDKTRSYLRISPVVLLVVAPLLGTSFIFFLPLLGIGVLFVLFLLPVMGAFSAVTDVALRICCGTEHKKVSSHRRSYHGLYKPTGASFTGAARKKRAACKTD